MTAADLPLSVWEGLRLWVIPPATSLVRETRVQSARENGAALLFKLAGVDDAATAQRLVGRYLLVLAEDCPDLADLQDEDGDDAWRTGEHRGHGGPGERGTSGGQARALGLQVWDRTLGLVGTIVEEQVGFAQTLWVVEGPFGEVLIPAVSELIDRRDDTTVFMDLPKGLVELNR